MELFKRNKAATAVLTVLAYITMFMFFVGLSAGGLIVASSASVFHIKAFKRVAMPAVILSTVCICLAGMFVLIDLGGIQRVWRIVTGPNPASPLVWDICVITCYLVINILYLHFMRKGAERAVAMVSRFALPCAILVHSVTAWIFGLQIAKEGWFTAIMAPIFVASAMDSGLALLLIVLSALMVAGPTAPFFWFEVIGGLLIPFCVLVFAKNRAKTGLVVGASVLVVAGVLCKRVWLLFTSFIGQNVTGAPGVMTADGWAMAGSYAPTLVEVTIIVGVVSVGARGFMALASKLLQPATEEETVPAATSRAGAPDLEFDPQVA